MPNKKAIFILESPLQMICGFEAINEFNLNKVSIILRLAENGRNNEQMLKLNELFFSKFKVQKVFMKPKSRNILSILYCLYLTLYSTVTVCRNYSVFIGYFDSKFARLLTLFTPSKKKFFLDDGVASLMYSNGLLHSGASFFSFFNLKTKKNTKNSFEYFSNFILNSNNSDKNKKNSLIFIGTPISESSSIVSFNEYLKIISYVKSKYESYSFLYFPHRREPKDRIKVIEKMGFKILYNKLPIEMIGYEFSQYYPNVVVSLFSTALFTMYSIYKSEIIACELAMEKKDTSKKEHLVKIYSEVKKIGTIIRL